MFAAFGLIATIFVGSLGYAATAAPRMARDSKIALDAFYGKCQKRDYSGAHALLSQSLQASLSPTKLKSNWQQFEAKNGPLRGWKVADETSIKGFAGSVCLFPPFVDYRHAVRGAKGSGALIYLRLVPENGAWRVERFNVLG
jgi:hypothetical protein